MIFTWCYILYYIYICIVSYIYIILIVLRPPCKQQTISFESWNLNSARPKNSDWSWFGEKLARSNFPLIHPSITFCYKTRRRLRLRLPTCESREEGVCGVRGGPGILFPYALGLDQDLTQYITIYAIYLIQNYSKLLETITKYALGLDHDLTQYLIQNYYKLLQNMHWARTIGQASRYRLPSYLSVSTCAYTWSYAILGWWVVVWFNATWTNLIPGGCHSFHNRNLRPRWLCQI